MNDPYIDALRQVFGHEHVVVGKKYRVRPYVGASDELYPIADQGLTCTVGRMRFTGDDELHRPLRIRQQPHQALRILQQQIGPLVGGKSAGEAQRQCVGAECSACRLDVGSACTGGLELHPDARARVLDQARTPRRAALPQRRIGN